MARTVGDGGGKCRRGRGLRRARRTLRPGRARQAGRVVRCGSVAVRRARQWGGVAVRCGSVAVAVLALAVAAAAGCVPPTTAPGTPAAPGTAFVTLVCPLPGETQVPPDATVTIRFSVPMEPKSAQAAVTVDPRAEFSAGWQDESTLVVTPKPGWPAGRKVTVAVGRTALSRDSRPLEKPYTWSFSVRPDFLRVVALRPEDGEVEVALDAALEATFDRSLDAASAGGCLDVSPATPGDASCRGNLLTFVPAGGWTPSTTYRVFIRSGPVKGLRGSDGKGLEAPVQFSFTTVTRTALWEVDLDDGETRQVASLASRAVAAVGSPDGRQMALVVEEELPDTETWGFFGSLWLMEADGSRQRRVAEGSLWTEANDVNNLWSPDGGRLAFSDVWHPERPAGLWVVPADDGPPRLVVSSGGDEGVKTANPAWSPDGERLAFRMYGDWRSHIFLVNADGSSLQEVGQFEVRLPEYSFRGLHWSPDGRYLSTEEEEGGEGGGLSIWVLDLEGQSPGGDGGKNVEAPRRLLAQGWRHAWSPDAQQVAYVEADGIWVVNAAGGTPKRVAQVEGVVRWGPCWSPDGYHLAYEAASEYSGPAQGFWVVRADGSRAWRLADMVTWGAKCWSKDGRKLYFLTSEGAPGGG